MFVDEIKLSVSSGAGGPGSVSFNNLTLKLNHLVVQVEMVVVS